MKINNHDKPPEKSYGFYYRMKIQRCKVIKRFSSLFVGAIIGKKMKKSRVTGKGFSSNDHAGGDRL